jgi:glutamate-1-semialdehyde 2,1-aminomutase
LLIFDEVITGARVAAGGAQDYYEVVPDISIVGKAIGGGYPMSAVGASKDLMQPIANGTLFQGGVYSGNALVMAGADAVLDFILANRQLMYERLHAVTNRLAEGVREIFTRKHVPHLVQNVGPLFSMFLTTRGCDAFHEYRDVRANCDFEKYITFQHAMQRAGVYFHPNQFEPLFLSTAHSNADVDDVLDRIDATLDTEPLAGSTGNSRQPDFHPCTHKG